jgi:hypothetical protein
MYIAGKPPKSRDVVCRGFDISKEHFATKEVILQYTGTQKREKGFISWATSYNTVAERIMGIYSVLLESYLFQNISLDAGQPLN